MALNSQLRAVAAQRRRALLAREICPVTIPQKKGDAVVVARRAPPRHQSGALAKLKGVVRPDGTVTAGNASGVNDGACALLLADEPPPPGMA
jgi:acetyl-CoA acyltransferase